MLTAEEANKLSAGKMNSIYFREVEPLIRKACDIGDYSCMYPTKRKESFEKAMVELGYTIAGVPVDGQKRIPEHYKISWDVPKILK